MRVEIRAFATLREFLPPADRARGSTTLDLSEGSTIADALRVLLVPREMPVIALRNGHEAPSSTILRCEDRVALYPPLIGGR